MRHRYRNISGRNIARFRRASGLSQAELAQRLTELNVPMSRQAIGRIERRERKLYDGEAYAIAEVVGQTVSRLLDERVRS